ncbi:hypothetical protein ACRRTK_003486 [Alexandromys fortis]
MFAETESLTEPGAHRFFSAAKPARLKVPFVSVSLEWEMHAMLSFLHKCWKYGLKSSCLLVRLFTG